MAIGFNFNSDEDEAAVNRYISQQEEKERGMTMGSGTFEEAQKENSVSIIEGHILHLWKRLSLVEKKRLITRLNGHLT